MYEKDLTEYKDLLKVGDKFVFINERLCDKEEKTLNKLGCETKRTKTSCPLGTHHYLEIVNIRELGWEIR